MNITTNTLALCLTALDTEAQYTGALLTHEDLDAENKEAITLHLARLIEGVEEIAAAYEEARTAANDPELPSAEDILNANEVPTEEAE